MRRLIKKIKTLYRLWKLLEAVDIDNKNKTIIIKGEAGKFILDRKGLSLELRENLRLNSKLLLFNCDLEFNPIEEEREKLNKRDIEACSLIQKK